MKLLIEIPDEQYEYIKLSDKNTFADVSSKECMLYAIKNGTPVSTSSDLISRSELKKALEEDMKCGGVKINEFDKGYDLGIKTAIEMLDNAPTVDLKDIYQEGHYDGQLEGYTKAINEERPQGEWIPVSERLPDKNGNYLCTVDYGENGVVVTQRNYWDTLGGFDKGYNKNDKVIAWQPLPEPYKKGDEE